MTIYFHQSPCSILQGVSVYKSNVSSGFGLTEAKETFQSTEEAVLNRDEEINFFPNEGVEQTKRTLAAPPPRRRLA